MAREPVWAERHDGLGTNVVDHGGDSRRGGALLSLRELAVAVTQPSLLAHPEDPEAALLLPLAAAGEAVGRR